MGDVVVELTWAGTEEPHVTVAPVAPTEVVAVVVVLTSPCLLVTACTIIPITILNVWLAGWLDVWTLSGYVQG